MNLYNTLTRQKTALTAIDPQVVKLYTCGPTVYHYAHIGNLRSYIFEDLLRRSLEFMGLPVRHVMNITDVGHLTSDADAGEDKMQKGAKREGKTVWQVAEFYTQAFFEDITRLNILHPSVICKATDHIPEMIAQIQHIEKNGLTYQAGGNLYFDTSKFKNYGQLAQLDKQELKAGARIDIDPNKKNPHDFVLWFTVSKHGDQDMQWDSPWGRGFPGWHIECSAMASKYLGQNFDIHCGGIDHIPVHHTNEIAQAEGAGSSHPWVQIWMHGNFLVLDEGAKMAKSGDNFLTLQTLIDRGYDPLDYRYFCLQAHYRKELRFSWEALDAAKSARRRLAEKTAALSKTAGDSTGTPIKKFMDAFSECLEDDLAIPTALGLISEVLSCESPPADLLATLLEFDKIFGLNLSNKETTISNRQSRITNEIQELINQREAARKAKDFKTSDLLRTQIESAGYLLKDTPSGPLLIKS